MKKHIYIMMFLFIFFIFLIPVVTAHVPLSSGDNISIEKALHVHEPTKSWAIYDGLTELEQAKYYRVNLKNGERLRISIYTPEEKNFEPGCVVMGTQLLNNGSLPDWVEIPEGFNYLVIEGERSSEAEYEPFTPTSYYFTVDYDREVNFTGTYYISVFERNNTGKFGIAIGYIEKFSADEWLMVPIDVINIHLWEGQNPGVIFAPLIVILIFGLGFMLWQNIKEDKIKLVKPPENILGWIGYTASLIYLGSGAMILHQMIIALSKSSVGIAVVVTLVFAFIPIVLGFMILLIVLREKKKFDKKDDIKFAFYGILGLIFWAGLLVGPILMILIGIISLLTKKYPKKVS